MQSISFMRSILFEDEEENEGQAPKLFHKTPRKLLENLQNY